MASVIKRGDVWYAKYRNSDGKRVRVALKASTKTEARRIAEELEQRAWRQRTGLEAKPDEFASRTVVQVLEWYRDGALKGKPSFDVLDRSIRLHLKPAFEQVLLADLTSADVENFLDEKAAGAAGTDDEPEGKGALGAQSLNHLRGYLVRAINRAKTRKKWSGPNAAAEAKPRSVHRKAYDFLHADEVPRFLAVLSVWWRRWYATRFYTGGRRSDLAGLRKTDVDLVHRRLRFARSYDRETTKGGHGDWIPIAADLVPYLEAAMEATPGELVFATPSGKMIPRDFKEVDIWRRALKRAGVVSHYTHVCRRKGCKHKEDHPDQKERRCPAPHPADPARVCGFKLWPKGHARAIRPYDTRATCASLLEQAGVRISAIARMLRHEDTATTEAFYVRYDPGELRGEIDKLKLRLPAEGARGPIRVQGQRGETAKAPEGAPEVERVMGLEPTTLSLGREFGGLSDRDSACEVLDLEDFRRRHVPTLPADRIENLISGSIWGPWWVRLPAAPARERKDGAS